jgi:hypothetical protein
MEFFWDGLKERKEKQKDKQVRIDWANHDKRVKDEKRFPEILDPGIHRDCYEKEVKWEVKKKRKKRYKKLWENTVPLTWYRGTFEISYEMVKRRRKEQEKEEIFLFHNFGYSYVKKERKPIIKDFNKLCYSEPRERRSESVDCECEAQTINHQSHVVMIRPAAETEVSNKNTYDRQRRYDESTPVSVDGIICLTLETDPKVLIDEAHHCNIFRSSEDGSLIQEGNVKALMQQKLEMKDGKCNIQAFGNNSTVSIRGLAAETEVSNKNTYDREKPNTECP